MDYLRLAQKVHLILRIGEETPGTQPVNVTGQSGVLAEIVQWVNGAHDDICRSRTQWSFMRSTFSMTLALGDRVITKADLELAYPDYDSVRPYVTNNGAFLGIVPTGVAGAAEEVVEYVPYQQWQGIYDAAPLSTGQPTYYTVTPDQSLEFNTIPDRAYTIRGGYDKKVIPLTVNGSLPMFPERYHNVIVWWAIVHYYCVSRDKTQELRAKSDVELKRELSKLYNEQLPDMTIG